METAPVASSPTLLLDQRAHGRRQRREARIDAMRATLETLERAVPVVLTLGDADDDVLWEGFLDEKVMRVRHFMRQSMRLSKEAKELQATQQQLQHLLREHRVTSRVLAGLRQEHENQPANEWERDVRRWCRLTRKHFKPWTREECEAEMQTALKEVNGFEWSQEKQTTGVSFLGWRDQRRVDHVRAAFQFEFHKTFLGYNVEDYRKVAWDSVTDPTTFYKINIGPSVKIVEDLAVGHLGGAHLEVLQRLDPDTVITRLTRRHVALGLDIHIIYLGFRVKTESGYAQYSRPICCPELIRVFDSTKDTWATNFIWCRWELLRDRDYKFSLGGSISAKNIGYAQQWMLEALACVFRAERMATGRGLITNDG